MNAPADEGAKKQVSRIEQIVEKAASAPTMAEIEARSAIEPTVRVGLWPMLVSGQLATDAKGILLLIDSEQSDEQKAITLWHETLHLLGLTDEDQVEILAKQLAGAVPKILDFVRRADDSDKSLWSELFLCQACYMGDVNLAMIGEKRSEAKETERAEYVHGEGEKK